MRESTPGGGRPVRRPRSRRPVVVAGLRRRPSVRRRRRRVLAGQQLRQRVVHLIRRRRFATRVGLQTGDERRRVVDVVGGRHQVGVVPQRVAIGDADSIRHRTPHRGCLAHAARAQLETDQRAECALGRTADGATASHGLGDAGGRGQARRRVLGDDVDPALDGGEEVLETCRARRSAPRSGRAAARRSRGRGAAPRARRGRIATRDPRAHRCPRARRVRNRSPAR